MSVLNYFKNTPGRPPIRRQALSVIFFSSNLQRGPWKKKGGHVAPATGDRVLSPPPRSTSGPARPRARQGPVAPSAGDRGACRPPSSYRSIPLI